MDAAHVVIVGAGFGGLMAARALGGRDARVTLIDRTNHHTFQPLLYQVATAGLNPADIATPIRRVMRNHKNVRVLLGEVTRVDLKAKSVVLENGEALEFDYLILATGATHSYFGHDDFAEFAPGLKTVDEGLLIRRRIFHAYERAERQSDPRARQAELTFVVVGAGPTGVEMAGALAEISRETLSHEFRSFEPKDARIVLLEGGPRVLGTYPVALSAKAERDLRGLGVEVRVGARVTCVTSDSVTIGAEEVLPTRTVIWAAGIAASPLARSLGIPLDPVGRVIVTPELSIPGHDHVYVIGDLAHVEQEGAAVAQMAPAAMQGGRAAVDNILRQLRGEARVPFRYLDKGSMATIGRRRAVAKVGKLQLKGTVAWLAWLFVHLMMLVGFKNRILVLLQWAWSYFTYDRGSRLIHGTAADQRVSALASLEQQAGPPGVEAAPSQATAARL